MAMLPMLLMLGQGCTNRQTVYVLDGKEVVVLKEGTTFTAAYDGTFYSERAEKRIMQVKQKR